MPILRPDSTIQEYVFTEQESISARILSTLQVQWLHTKYAQLAKEKIAKLIPSQMDGDRRFICEIAELDGKMDLLQEIMQDCVDAMKELSDPEKANKLHSGKQEEIVDTTQTRAANFVNNPPQT